MNWGILKVAFCKSYAHPYDAVMMLPFRKKRIFLDFASGTPLAPQVSRALRRVIEGEQEGHFGNPSAFHAEGRSGKALLTCARERIAQALSVRAEEVVFTSGATESSNLAIQGFMKNVPKRFSHIITSSAEHPSLIEPIRALERTGIRVTSLPLDTNGRISPDALQSALTKETGLIALSLVNGELGTLLPARRIKTLLSTYKASLGRVSFSEAPFFYLDASQAFNLLPVKPHDLGADFLAIDGSKIYGPRGSGVLFMREGTSVQPILLGGGQERGRRSGTENILNAAGLAEAVMLCEKMRERERRRMKDLEECFTTELGHHVREAIHNAVSDIHSIQHVCFPGANAEFLSVLLDEDGVAVATSSACRRQKGKNGSPGVLEIPGKEECARSSLRFSFGRDTTKRDILHALSLLKKSLPLARASP